MIARTRASRTLSLTRPLDCTAAPKASTTPPSTPSRAGSMVCRPLIERSRVDLPEPDGPISATISPLATSRLTLSSARRCPKVFETARMERTAAAVMRSFES